MSQLPPQDCPVFTVVSSQTPQFCYTLALSSIMGPLNLRLGSKTQGGDPAHSRSPAPQPSCTNGVWCDLCAPARLLQTTGAGNRCRDLFYLCNASGIFHKTANSLRGINFLFLFLCSSGFLKPLGFMCFRMGPGHQQHCPCS